MAWNLLGLSYYYLQSYDLMQLKYKQKSLKNKLNNVVPNIETSRTPDKIFLMLLVAHLYEHNVFFLQDKNKYNAPNSY